MAKKFIALYAGETENEEGKKCGTETIRRIKKCLDYINSHPGDEFTIILGAGIRPDKPEYPMLKSVMKSFMQDIDPDLQITLASQDEAWGTLQESRAILEEIENIDKVLICSSWYHIPRIKLIWFLISKGEIKTKGIWAPSPKFSSVGMEILSFIKLAFDFFIRKR